MSFEFRISTRRRGMPGANNSPFTRKLSITISTITPVVRGASGSGGASVFCWGSRNCSVSISMSDLGGHPGISLVERGHVFTPLAKEPAPLGLGQRPHDNGIELGSRVAQDLLHRVLVRSGLAVRPLGRHCDIGIEHGKHARGDRNLFPRYAAGIALAVVTLVMAAHHFRQLAEEADLAQH